VFDGSMAWRGLAADAQASVHLPAHTGQLRDLRT